MSALRRFLLRCLAFLRRAPADRQLERELSAHLGLLEEEYRRQGLSPDEAARAARRAFGALEPVKEHHRDARSFRWLDDARRDAVYALRMLGRSRGFTAAAVATLALGIGAATVIFSLLHSILLAPFPYTAPRRMVDVLVRDSANRVFRGPLPPDEFEAYLQAGDVFEDAAGTIGQSMHFVGTAGAQRVSVGWGTPNMFTFLGVPPLHGRVWGPADAAPGAPPVAVLNHRAWQTIFGSDPAIVGRTVLLDDTPRTVIGIMPPRFEWHVADFWIPGALDASLPASNPSRARWFQARLRPGVTIEEAEARLKVIATNRAQIAPNDYPPGSRVQVITIIDWVAGQFRYVLYTLFGAVTLLLVIACCNVANMLLARATVREHEITVRMALGASRSRLVRQLLVESAVLAAGGLAGGVLVAYGGIALLAALLPRQGVAWEVALALDVPVLAFALAAAAAATFVFGLVPAIQAARPNLLPGASGNRSGTAGRQQHRLRNALVVAEVAISLVLLLGAGLMARSFLQLARVNLGINVDHLYAAALSFPPETTEAAPQQAQIQDVLSRLRRIPGVQSVAASSSLLGGMRTAFSVPGTPAAPEPPQAVVQFGTEEVVRTLGLRVTMGRDLDLSDVLSNRKVALISEAFVKQQFAGTPPIGRTIRLDRLAAAPFSIADPTFEVVGVVSDVANMGPYESPMPHVIVPYGLRGAGQVSQIVLRTAGEVSQLATAMRAQVRAVDSRIGLTPPQSAADGVDQGLYAQPRFSMMVVVIFAVTGLGLAALGIYGVISYTVSQQTREIAIRMALGGERRHVRLQVLGFTLRLMGAGIVLGLLGGFLVARLIATQLWNVAPHDPLTFATAGAVILGVGVMACAVPARRATRVTPAAALRHD